MAQCCALCFRALLCVWYLIWHSVCAQPSLSYSYGVHWHLTCRHQRLWQHCRSTASHSSTLSLSHCVSSSLSCLVSLIDIKQMRDLSDQGDCHLSLILILTSATCLTWERCVVLVLTAKGCMLVKGEHFDIEAFLIFMDTCMTSAMTDVINMSSKWFWFL